MKVEGVVRLKKLAFVLLSTMLLGGFFLIGNLTHDQDKLAYDPGGGPIGGGIIGLDELAYDPGGGPIGGGFAGLDEPTFDPSGGPIGG